MAKRFGGQYSPGGDPRPAPGQPVAKRSQPVIRRSPAGARVNFLFAVPFLWAFSAFFRDPAGLAQHLGVFALLMLSAWLTREGVIAQDAYDERRVARRPAIPRKLFASVLMGAGLALAGLGDGLFTPILFGVLGGALHLAAFGLDPMRDKGMEGIDEFQTDRVARAVTEAEGVLAEMTDAIARARNRRAEARLTDFQAQARDLLRAVENDPAQLSAVRRYMGVYLRGARDATVKFADLYARTQDKQAETEYLALLDDLDQNFALRTDSLIDSDRVALDIEMDVLRERLEREGLKPQAPTP